MSEKSRKDIIECRRYDGKLSEKCRRYLVKYKSLSIKNGAKFKKCSIFTLFTIFKLRYQSDTEFFVNPIEYNKIPNKGRFYE